MSDEESKRSHQSNQSSPNTGSILKTPSRRKRKWIHKSTRFDEGNIKQTYHPSDKDYGLIKIDEPPTPYPDGNKKINTEELKKTLQDLKDKEMGSSENFSEEKRRKHEEFAKKRKRYHAKEYDRDRISQMKISDDTDENHKQPNDASGKSSQ